MRGTRFGCRRPHLHAGIIPAYAGNTLTYVRSDKYSQDHPRVCGEHSYPLSTHASIMGSSPRMRGTPHLTELTDCVEGIIPAYAGNTRPALARRSIARDHPRVCGEHHQHRGRFHFRRGSSPRMRGTHGRLLLLLGRNGIIPAYAGNTRSTRQPARPERDHPRVCGEHRSDARLRHRQRGSSPRMRGTHPHPAGNRRGQGIIPAYAGNTRFEPFSYPPMEDHPRVCGEHR